MVINQLIKKGMSKSDNVNLVLGREEVYKASPRILSFKFTDDIVNGINLNLSNMVSAYPFEYGGHQKVMSRDGRSTNLKQSIWI
jgi:hypothetical protein